MAKLDLLRLASRSLAVCLVGFVLLEIGLRFFGYGQYIMYRPDDDLLWLPRANQQGRTVSGHHRITINSDSLRYPEDYALKDPEEIRVYVFGDSVSMGWGVDDESHFSAVLERLLLSGNDDGSRYRVISAGVNAYPTALCVRRFRTLLSKGHQIDVAVLAYSFNWGIEHFTEMQGREKEKLLAKIRLKSVLRRSAFYNYFVEDLLRAAVYYRLRDKLIAGTWDTVVDESDDKLRHYRESLELMRAESERAGVQLGFLLLGSEGQDELNDHQIEFKEFARRSGVPLVNVVEAFQRHDGTLEDLFLEWDVNHPNAAGHAAIAELLLPMVERLSPELERPPS